MNIKTNATIKSAQIFDANGRLLQTIIGISDNKIEVSNLKQGTYLLQLNTENGKIVEKFVK